MLLLCVRVTNCRRVIIGEAIKVHITTRAHCLPAWLCYSVYWQPCELSVKVVCRLAVRAVVSARVQRCWDALAVDTHTQTLNSNEERSEGAGATQHNRNHYASSPISGKDCAVDAVLSTTGLPVTAIRRPRLAANMPTIANNI
eukprot:10981-Heterococcus_DN1.PRE.1